jgi:ubiquinone/menaquinone biosynthesis C-methylase UbiE
MDAQYIGVDGSSTMVALVQRRLTRLGSRAVVLLTTGDLRLDMASCRFDRFLSTYVLDLLSQDHIQLLLAEAHRGLAPGGLLRRVSLAPGFTLLSMVVEKGWWAMYRLRPALLGGCRPMALEAFVKGGWDIQHIQRRAKFGVPSEVLVAKKV